MHLNLFTALPSASVGLSMETELFFHIKPRKISVTAERKRSAFRPYHLQMVGFIFDISFIPIISPNTAFFGGVGQILYVKID